MCVSRRLVLLVAAFAALTAAGEKPKGLRAPQVEILEVMAHRTSEGTIEVDGRVRNCGERALDELTLGFEMIAPGGEVVTTQRGVLEGDHLEPGSEAEFHWRMRDSARVTSFQVTARERGHELEVAKPGPYPVE
jgi:hypothetical protein